MSAGTDYSHQNHLVGTNEYDADMDLVESFVRAHQRPDDRDAQEVVVLYYRSRLLHYWQFTKEYVNSSQNEQELELTQQDYRQPYSAQEMAAYQAQFEARLKAIQADFEATGRLNLELVSAAFYFIGTISCRVDFEEEPSPQDHNLFPLPNAVGLFAINTYLYGFFEGIQLRGATLKTAYFDAGWGCPKTFMNHDRAHFNNINRNYLRRVGLEEQAHYKGLYYQTLNDPELSMIARQCVLATMWAVLHEVYRQVRLPIHLEGLIWDLKWIFDELLEATEMDLAPLFASFAGLTLAADNKDSLLELARTYHTSDEEGGWGSLLLVLVAEEAEELDPEEQYFLHFSAAYWYTGLYFRDHAVSAPLPKLPSAQSYSDPA